ncbi:MAG: glycosyltransferase [Actinobacteria bacterium]|nr:glycosyltransferase [Actinomycetota bacterium]
MSPRVLTLALSVMWRHVTEDPVRALLLGWRVLPGRVRPWLRWAGPYGPATVAWGSGRRKEALAVLDTEPRRLAAFALAVDRPETARAALDRMPANDPARALLLARLAGREGRLRAAVAALDGVPGRKQAKVRGTLGGELYVLEQGIPRPDRLPRRRGSYQPEPGRVLHLVTDALPTTNAGYTVRTQQIGVAQRQAGLDPHVVTKAGFPVAQGHLDGRRVAVVDGLPYHRLLPYRLPPRPDAAASLGYDLAVRLVGRLRPAVLHAASNHLNGQLALALREEFGLPVIYEARGFWEETWLSRHGGDPGDPAGQYAGSPARSVPFKNSEKGSGDAAGSAGTAVTGLATEAARDGVVPLPLPGPDLARSDFYLLSREAETRCMKEADLVVTLGEVMRAEIVARGVAPDKVLVVPNAVSEEFLQPLPDASRLRTELGLRPGEQVAGVVSNLVGYEGIDTLLAAIAELRSRGLAVRPLIVGDGPERAALERQAGQLGLTGTAIFTGRVPMADVRKYHALLDLFVIPRTNDRVCQLVTPLKPIEAMASGLTVVASDVGALREIIRPEVTGALATSGDPGSFADIMEPLLYSSDIRRKLGANAREWVARDRTWAYNAAIYRAAYQRLGAAQ